MEIQLGNILEGACAMAGYETDVLGAPTRWRQMAAMAVNEGLRRIHAEKFPALRRVEWRRYRPQEADLGAAAARYAEGQECWHEGSYWRKIGDGWRGLKMEEVSAFVAFDQPWEVTEIDPGGVVLEDFAYVADPKYRPAAAAVQGCGWFADGVMLPAPAPAGVYVRFIPKAPRISYMEWNGEQAYARGAGCYVSAERECYVAREDVAGGGDAPGTNARWTKVRVRDEFEAYLTELAAAALLTEDQGRYQTKAAAEAEFEELQARFAEGLGDSRMRCGRFRR